MQTKTTARCYRQDCDYERVARFLVRTYNPDGSHVNWLQPRWEYMHYHPAIRKIKLGSFGVWEADSEIVGVVHLELDIGAVYFQIDPAYAVLKNEMLAYAEEQLFAATDGGKILSLYINDRDDKFQRMVAKRGFQRTSSLETVTQLTIPDSLPAIKLPDGFRLKSLSEDNDLKKLNRVIFRGFNHGNEPPNDGIEERKFMQSSPNYRKDLNVVVEAPDGNFVSYCGMLYEPVNHIAYPEPVCTDPDYRRMGLGRAAICESIRRCNNLGAKLAYCAEKPIYLSIGFQRIFSISRWQREWK